MIMSIPDNEWLMRVDAIYTHFIIYIYFIFLSSKNMYQFMLDNVHRKHQYYGIPDGLNDLQSTKMTKHHPHGFGHVCDYRVCISVNVLMNTK